MSRPKRSGGRKKKFAEDEDFDDSEESDVTDSDFEDPDEMEVPMGGKSLTANVNKKNADGSDDDIEVISSVNNGSGAKFGNFAAKRPSLSASELRVWLCSDHVV
eukprot:GFUD01105768.1.p1 GENE.GFUD01105768.1~~GFUD01105768.1.p1  ORF type:complete len:104 (+),score=28.05 GFUD01105768.1:100-411(+)